MSETSTELTIKLLGPHVKKTPLTHKLLSRPPFRYLHDLLTELIAKTNFAQGLYSDAELDSANVSDKDSKITFLQKFIDCAKLVSDDTPAVKPAKIVAGLDAEDTNTFLQFLARDLLKLDSSAAVAQILGKSVPTKLGSTEKLSPSDAPKLKSNNNNATAKSNVSTGNKKTVAPKSNPASEISKKVKETSNVPAVRPTTATVRRPTTAVGNPAPISIQNIISAGTKDESEDMYVIAQKVDKISISADTNNAPESGEHGGLVKKILATHQALNETTTVESPSTMLTNTLQSKESAALQKQVDSLRQTAQDLTRVTAPLGHMLDYYQEDMDSLSREMGMWKDQVKKYRLEFESESAETVKQIEPLELQLRQLDAQIDEKVNNDF